MYWPYHEPNRLKGKDHEDQHEGGILIPEEEQTSAGPSIELRVRPSPRLREVEEGWEDQDAITALPPVRII